ncbi:MAG TPA: excisionase family DNA-binding protein [Mycobacterium sp.]
MATTTLPSRRRLVSIADAAEYAAVSTITVRRRISDGTLTAYRVGPRLLRVDLNEVDQRLLRPVATVGGDRVA